MYDCCNPGRRQICDRSENDSTNSESRENFFVSSVIGDFFGSLQKGESLLALLVLDVRCASGRGDCFLNAWCRFGLLVARLSDSIGNGITWSIVEQAEELDFGTKNPLSFCCGNIFSLRNRGVSSERKTGALGARYEFSQNSLWLLVLADLFGANSLKSLSVTITRLLGAAGSGTFKSSLKGEMWASWCSNISDFSFPHPLSRPEYSSSYREGRQPSVSLRWYSYTGESSESLRGPPPDSSASAEFPHSLPGDWSCPAKLSSCQEGTRDSGFISYPPVGCEALE